MKYLRVIIIWSLAIILTLAMAKHQKRTGPTYPVDGVVHLGTTEIDYLLKRSHGGESDHMVQVEVDDPEIQGFVYWKRLRMDEEYTVVPMVYNENAEIVVGHGKSRTASALEAPLPHQPPAGKLEYHVQLSKGEYSIDIPEEETVVIRYKGAVPMSYLLPHILTIFLAMFFSTRTAIGVIAGEKIKTFSLVTFITLVLGGLIFGPIVQKFAFGEFWTGWPNGEDLTDNKLAVAAIAWLIAVILNFSKKREKIGRWFTMAAFLILLSVFLIPHSMNGSSFDYEAGAVVTGQEIIEQPSVSDNPNSEGSAETGAE
jgi:hypothetical protein